MGEQWAMCGANMWGETEIACMHAIQPDNNTILPVSERVRMHAQMSVSVCVCDGMR